MLHPDVVLKKGGITKKGLFSKKKIPKGTIVYKVKDDVRIYSISQYNKFSKRYQNILTKFAYQENDKIIHHVDNTKHGNHSCESNVYVMQDNAYMDIALRDIEAGEEVTWDYGVLLPTWHKPLRCKCGSSKCRGMIYRLPPNSKVSSKLKLLAKKAKKDLLKVKQPLLDKRELQDFQRGLEPINKNNITI